MPMVTLVASVDRQVWELDCVGRASVTEAKESTGISLPLQAGRGRRSQHVNLDALLSFSASRRGIGRSLLSRGIVLLKTHLR